jgi:hypothetical protein
MAARILDLIDKVDSFEILRDEIAAILAVEIANQQALATADDQDPNDWKLRVFLERSRPWAEFESAPEQANAQPIVNVWFDSLAVQLAASNVVERQRVEGVYNIDCYGYGVSEETETGHTVGDERAAIELHRAVRLVRNILMSAHYTYLGQQGLVGKRMIQSISAFQPQIDGQSVQNVQAARLALHVEFNEFSPQVTGQPIELVSATVKRAETGEIFFTALYGDEDS